MTGIEDIAVSWLADPAWQKVFKHTVDIFQDYVSYVLIAIGAICLSVRLLGTLGIGDLVCMIMGVEYDGNTNFTDLGPYPSGGTLGMISYANTVDTCIKAVYNLFFENLPYILLTQTLILIVTEKFTFRIPRIAQRVERFYKNIVEESLFGKDPDVAEDMHDTNDTSAISRRRQRNEICVTLKRSSIIHDVYIAKNILEILLIMIAFLPMNMILGIDDHHQDVLCKINIVPIPGLYEKPGAVYFQCSGKKMTFYNFALWAHNSLLIVYGLCALYSIIWCLYFRAVTNLLKTIETMKKEGSSLSKLKDAKGKDFLFLFDLLAHSCGLESTLRVLTHSDQTFYEICKPKVDMTDSLELEEDKLRIKWGPSDIELWLQSGSHKKASQRSIEIDNYEVTIFPAESVNHTHTLQSITSTEMENTPQNTSNPVNGGPHPGEFKHQLSGTDVYSTWFKDLNGGRTEYVLTIATMIGKSRMKGEKVVTNLVPYGAERPRSGMTKSACSHSVEIFWDPPKGEFTKYELTVIQLFSMPYQYGTQQSYLSKKSSQHSMNGSEPGTPGTPGSFLVDPEDLSSNHSRVMDLSHKIHQYTIWGLEPGERYKVILKTITGNVVTRQAISDVILTCPLPPSGIRIAELTSSTCLVTWNLPDGHPCLKNFQIQVRSPDGNVLKDFFVPKETESINVEGLQPCNDYDIAMTAICVAGQNIRTESETSWISFTSRPEQVWNLRLVDVTTNSISIQWDPPVVSMNLKYKITINGNIVKEEVPKITFDLIKSPPQIIVDDQDQKYRRRMSTIQSTQSYSSFLFNRRRSSPQVRRQSDLLDILDYSCTFELPGDKNQFTFKNLPETVGSGHAYEVTVVAMVLTQRIDKTTETLVHSEVSSEDVKDCFMTRPLPPTDIQIDPNGKPLQICWQHSKTKSVNGYIVQWIPVPGQDNADGYSLIEEDTVDLEALNEDDDKIYFTFPIQHVQVGTAYNVNVYAVAESFGFNQESDALTAKIMVLNDKQLEVYEDYTKC